MPDRGPGAGRRKLVGGFAPRMPCAAVIVGPHPSSPAPVSRSELPHTLKLMTVWLLIGLLIFLGFKFWEREREASRFQLAGGVVVLTRAADGHFHWPGRVGDVEVDFLVDTGATATAIPQALAERAGLQPLGAVRTHTAGGTVTGFLTKADITLDGGVAARRLTVTVLPNLGAPLLGMDVLGRLHFSQKPGELRITPSP